MPNLLDRVAICASTGTLPLLVLLSTSLAGCGGEIGSGRGGVGEAQAAVTLSNAYASPRALGEAVLKALRENDKEALNALRITREEHLHLFWPELPESDDTPFDFAWQLNNDRSWQGVNQALAEYGGKAWELLDLAFTDPPEVYPTFTVHFGAQLRVRRVSDGKEGYLPILDVVVERQGQWKLMNFRED